MRARPVIKAKLCSIRPKQLQQTQSGVPLPKKSGRAKTTMHSLFCVAVVFSVRLGPLASGHVSRDAVVFSGHVRSRQGTEIAGAPLHWIF